MEMEERKGVEGGWKGREREGKEEKEFKFKGLQN